MEIVLKKLNGYSGSDIYLMKDEQKTFIRKINNIERNYNQLIILKNLGLDVPLVYKKSNNLLDMEYINGFDMKTYINNNTIQNFLNYIVELVQKLSQNSLNKDYTETYYRKLKWMDEHNEFPFTAEQFISSLPKYLPQSFYHGDLTMENILYGDKFYLIDCMTTDYDSWVFDLAKLRQDLKVGWFIRHDKNINITNYLSIIDKKIINDYPIISNNSLLILMLLRVYLYTKPNTYDRDFLLKEIKQLWI
jgi:RIO-like serine/threonine protein kinase